MGEHRDARVVVQARLGPHADAWDGLVERQRLPSPFLRSWWLAHTAGPNPRFVLVLRGEVLVGGLALQEDRWLGVPRVRVMGAGPLCPDHLDAVALPGHEEEVLAALASWLGRPGSRLLDLEGMAAPAGVAAALPGRVRQEVIDVAPWAPLPSDPGQWLRGRSRNFRSNLRKAVNRLEREAATCRVTRGASVEAALATLRRLHAARWGRRSRFLSAYERFAAAGRAGAARGEFVFHELVAGEAVVAAMGCFEVAGRISVYQSGWLPTRRWRNASTLLLTRAIEDACRRGLTELDLLRGNEPYKRSFAPATRQLLRLRAAHGWAGRLALTVLVLAQRSRRLAGSVRGLARTRLPGLGAPAGTETVAQRRRADQPGLGTVDQG